VTDHRAEHLNMPSQAYREDGTVSVQMVFVHQSPAHLRRLEDRADNPVVGRSGTIAGSQPDLGLARLLVRSSALGPT